MNGCAPFGGNLREREPKFWIRLPKRGSNRLNGLKYKAEFAMQQLL
jgi:hypothetical protein